MQEYDVTEPEVIGEIPADLNGIYIRNTENPVHESLGRYHPFDGDGMLHSIHFDSGRCEYR
ncbi:MAG: apocarotenoid-15,15'-oxygenase, partial [Gammaproteobacteria bacterium]|nr:apocarotenoid-15,15'-oxygenase [Gammaproteobacteria bacterium]